MGGNLCFRPKLNILLQYKFEYSQYGISLQILSSYFCPPYIVTATVICFSTDAKNGVELTVKPDALTVRVNEKSS